MPDVTAGSGEGVLATWLVEESARFDAAQTIAYVETADELFSVEAGRPGLLLKTLISPGTRVAPGTPIGILGEPWEQVVDLEAVIAELAISTRERVASSSWFEAPVSGHQVEAASEAAPRAAPEQLTIVAELPPLQPEPAGDPLDPDDLGDLDASVQGRHSAPADALGIDDLEALAGETHTHQAAEDRSTDVEAPLHHHYLRARIRADRLLAVSAQLERDHPDSGVDDLITRAVLAAHRQVPQLATAHLEDGNKAAMGIPVSHPGRFGVEEAVAVVPTGQTAALAVGAVRDEPVIDGGAVVPGKLITLTLSVRPGRVDDVQASRWLAVLVALLERPEWLRD